MSTPSSYKPSDMVQSMEVSISSFTQPFTQITQKFTQTEINSLHLGNNQVRLTNQAMINHIRHSNLSSLKPSMEIAPKYTKLNQQLYSAGAGIPQSNSYTYGTSDVLIDPGNGSNLGSYSTNAFIYMYGTETSWLNIVNNILTNSFILQNSQSNPPTSELLTQNNNWLPNQYGSGPSYWYNCSIWTEDCVAQQIIIYAALYAYINTIIKGQMVNPQVYMNLYTNILCSVGGAYPDGWDSPPYNVGNISFSTNWPFELNSIILNSYLSPMTPGQQPSTIPANQQNSVPYDSYGGNLPTGLSGLTTLDENDMLNLFQINMPQVLNSGNNSVTSYSSSPTNVVSLTQPGNTILMSFLPTAFVTNSGQTTVTINGVSFNVNLPSYAINFIGWTDWPGSPTFTTTQSPDVTPGWVGNYPNYAYAQWILNTQQPIFSPGLPTPVLNLITMEFTSSNPLLPVVDYNVYTGTADAAGQYVSVSGQLNNNGQQTTITATAYLFGQPIPNATYSYNYTFTLPSMSPFPPFNPIGPNF